MKSFAAPFIWNDFRADQARASSVPLKISLYTIMDDCHHTFQPNCCCPNTWRVTAGENDKCIPEDVTRLKECCGNFLILFQKLFCTPQLYCAHFCRNSSNNKTTRPKSLPRVYPKDCSCGWTTIRRRKETR